MNSITSYALLNKDNLVVNVFVNVGILTEIGISSESSSVIEYGSPDCLVLNDAAIGYSLDTDLNAFIPPKQDPTYILNETTWNWEPDPELEYDLHNDGKKYKYDAANLCWIPTWKIDNI